MRSLIMVGSCLVISQLVFSITGRQGNNPPQVRIESPKTQSHYDWNAVVPYTITVSDKEDGESKYEEIPATEIFLEWRYFPDPAKANAFLSEKNHQEPAGCSLIKQQDCFTCHATHAKLIGPSFSDVANKYRKSPDLPAIARRVINGSTGIWGAVSMPTHPNLKEEDAQSIVRWILDHAGDPDTDYFRGASGSIRLQRPSNATQDGIFVLKATYTDHGINDDPATRRMGQQMITLGPIDK